jgi:hypothetical protein
MTTMPLSLFVYNLKKFSKSQKVKSLTEKLTALLNNKGDIEIDLEHMCAHFGIDVNAFCDKLDTDF